MEKLKVEQRILVAVGLVFNEQQQVLMAQRQAHQDQANLWEFPGGKVEPGESLEDALARELLEEVGIQVGSHQPFLEESFNYPHKRVHLSVHRILSFTGNPIGLERQKIAWVGLRRIKDYPVPAANKNIVNALWSMDS